MFSKKYKGAMMAFSNQLVARGWFDVKMPSYQYRNSHCGDTTILRPTIVLSPQWDFLYWSEDVCIESGPWVIIAPAVMSRVSCQKGPTCHAYAWQIGPFWQDTLDFHNGISYTGQKMSVFNQDHEWPLHLQWCVMSGIVPIRRDCSTGFAWSSKHGW